MRVSPPVQEIFTRFQIKYFTTHGNEIKFLCPFHEASGAQSHNASINRKTGEWLCYNGHCAATGHNIAEFIAKYLKKGKKYAIKWLKKNYGYDHQDYSFEDDEGPSEEQVRYVSLPDTYRPIVNSGWIKEYAEKECLEFHILQAFRVGINMEKKGGAFKYPSALLLPFYFRGKCIGWAYKYIFGKYTYHFPKKNFLYGLDMAKRREYVYVVEGPRDVWRLRGFGLNVVGLCGSSPSPKQINCLMKNFSSIIVCTDGDDAGRGARDRLYYELRDMMDVKVVELPEGEDPCSFSTDKEDFMKLKIWDANDYYRRIR